MTSRRGTRLTWFDACLPVVLACRHGCLVRPTLCHNALVLTPLPVACHHSCSLGLTSGDCILPRGGAITAAQRCVISTSVCMCVCHNALLCHCRCLLCALFGCVFKPSRDTLAGIIHARTRTHSHTYSHTHTYAHTLAHTHTYTSRLLIRFCCCHYWLGGHSSFSTP